MIVAASYDPDGAVSLNRTRTQMNADACEGRIKTSSGLPTRKHLSAFIYGFAAPSDWERTGQFWMSEREKSEPPHCQSGFFHVTSIFSAREDM